MTENFVPNISYFSANLTNIARITGTRRTLNASFMVERCGFPVHCCCCLLERLGKIRIIVRDFPKLCAISAYMMKQFLTCKKMFGKGYNRTETK